MYTTAFIHKQEVCVYYHPIEVKATSTKPCVSRTQKTLKYFGIMLILITKITCLVTCDVRNVYTNKCHYSMELYYTSFKLISISIA